MTASFRRPCKACGRELLFVVNGFTGKTVPLDVSSHAHIYELVDAAEGGDVAYPSKQEVFVSHFLTCPKASEFSKRNEPKQGELL